MGMYLSIKTSKITDRNFKDKLDDYYISSSFLSVFDFDIREFLNKSEDDEYIQCLKNNNLDEAIKDGEKAFILFDKKINNFLKILSCIVISSYSNKENQIGKENTFKIEINQIKSFYKDFLQESEKYLNEDKDISEIHDKYNDEILNITYYIDNVLEKFENSFKSEQSITNEMDYLFGEIYNLIRLLNLLKIAKKYNLELLYQ